MKEAVGSYLKSIFQEHPLTRHLAASCDRNLTLSSTPFVCDNGITEAFLVCHKKEAGLTDIHLEMYGAFSYLTKHPEADQVQLITFYPQVSLIPRGPVCKFDKRDASKVSMYDSYVRSDTANHLGLARGILSHSPITPQRKQNKSKSGQLLQSIHPLD